MFESDSSWMRLALAEAERGRGLVEPNPMVGAVVVRDGRCLAVGHHGQFGGAHAEVEALRGLGDEARGSTLYVTLEPCSHYGKTPPCVDSVLRSGITRVVAALSDPFPQVSGAGFARLRQAGVEVVVGVEEEAARRLVSPFLKRVFTGRPYVIAKWAMTLDGRIATRTGDSRWISSKRSRALVHEVRGRMDGILVGIGTALADDPMLTARPAGPRIPVRIVLDSDARLPIGSRLVSTARDVPVWVVTANQVDAARKRGLEAAGCLVLEVGSARPIELIPMLDELGTRGLTNLLVEGGGTVLGSFLDAGEVDEVDVFIAPKLVGGVDASSPLLGRGVERMDQALDLIGRKLTDLNPDLRIQGFLHRPWLEVDGKSSS